MDPITIISSFVGISFITYGINSFISKRMIREFKRWGLADKRKIIGICQFIGGAGILLGFEYGIANIISAIFIIIMMLVAIFVRIQIKDNISDILPAISYILLCFIIIYLHLYG
jgi:uncharacterized membrane protein YphA (DoxX/SURF4 family)